MFYSSEKFASLSMETKSTLLLATALTEQLAEFSAEPQHSLLREAMPTDFHHLTRLKTHSNEVEIEFTRLNNNIIDNISYIFL